MAPQQPRIAIIGSGISGLTAAYYLQRRFAVQVFEAEAEIGGHTATKPVQVNGQDYWIDTGFIVFNSRTYPHFLALLAELNVPYQTTEMGFSVHTGQGYEYAGTSLNGLFAQRKNLFSRSHWRMLLDIVRFNRLCTRMAEQGQVPENLTLGAFLQQHGFSQGLRNHYILPMVAAIWSSSLGTAAQMPLVFFIQFFHHHGLLTITQQPQWYTVCGGSHRYLQPLTAGFSQAIHRNCPVTLVERDSQGVWVTSQGLGRQRFDEVVFACHSDQALSLLAQPTAAEREVLGAIPYERNQVVLHHDTQLLPRSRRAWASWNYQLAGQPNEKAVLTYNMNILQNLQAPEVFCVSVNPGAAVNPATCLGEFHYSHPTFTLASISAQKRWSDINHQHHTHYCGAYWFNGFHEDGVVSARRVASGLGIPL